MPDVFGALPAIFVIVFVIGGILFAVVKGISQWSYNNSQPVQSLPAQLVTKRTDTSGGGSRDSMRRVNTWHYVTFGIEDGQRQEFSAKRAHFRRETGRGERTTPHDALRI